MLLIRKTGHVIQNAIDTKSQNSNSYKDGDLSEPDEELERLRRKYLKKPDEDERITEIDALQKMFCAVSEKYTSGLRLDSRIPQTMRSGFDDEMRTFNRTMSLALAKVTVKAFDNESTPDKAIEQISPVFQESISRFSNILYSLDQEYRGYLLLTEIQGYTSYLFMSERTESSCDRCESNHGRVLSQRDLESGNLIPPLHPNCRCQLVAMDNAAVFLYNMDRQGFTFAVDNALELIGGNSGGIFLLDHEFLNRGISPQTLRRLLRPDSPAITDASHTEANWFQDLKDWAVKFGTDAMNFVDAWALDFLYRADHAFDDFASFIDYITFGSLFDTINSQYERVRLMEEHPESLYHSINAYTLGLMDLFNGAVNPEEPWSFEHVMHIIGSVLVLYGAYRGAKSIAADFGIGIDDAIDDAARSGNSLLDDMLDDAAIEGGGKVNAGNFDDLPSNAKDAYKGYEGNGWKGNYSGQTPGTNAGRAWNNNFGDLPAVDSVGISVTYREFDVNNRISGVARDAERFLVGSDGSVYYTPDHYTTFTKIK